MNKRNFLKLSLLGLSALPAISHIDKLVAAVAHLPDEDLAGDTDFWRKIRASYKLNPDYINLENGYYCFLPEETLERFLQHVREVNYQGSYYMRTYQIENKKKVRTRLAEMAG